MLISSLYVSLYPISRLNVIKVKNNIPYIPPEIIRIILCMLRDDKKTLTACALVNSTFNLHATPILYHTVTFTYPNTFTLFVNATNSIKLRCSQTIRHLDLSGFSTCGLQKSSSAIQKVVTPDLLIHILRSFPRIEAFSISETLESMITHDVLKVLLLECKNVKIIDFSGFANKQSNIVLREFANFVGSVKIVQRYDEVTDIEDVTFQRASTPILSHLRRLSFHESPVISECSAIIPILAHAPNLTHLDLGGCSISNLTLDFLATETNAPGTLTHLSLAKCKNISSNAIASLVFKCSQLETLNLYGERNVNTAISECDLMTILCSPSAKKLQTLDIGSSQITPLILSAIKDNCSSSLRNLGIAKAQITNISSISNLLTAIPNLQYVNLTSVPCFNPLNTNGFIASLSKTNHQIHTIEMSEFLLKKLRAVDGWKISANFGRRWYYAVDMQGLRPDRVHGRKLDMTECGTESMSKIFQYYCYGV